MTQELKYWQYNIIIMEAFDKTVEKFTPFLDNEYVTAGLSIFLIAYAGLAAPKLPESVAKLFDSQIVKFIMFFMIVYVSRRNATVAIIATIALMVSLMTLNKIKVGKELMASVKNSEEGAVKKLHHVRGCRCQCDAVDDESQEENSRVHPEVVRIMEEESRRSRAESESLPEEARPRRMVTLQEESSRGMEESHMSVEEHRAEEARQKFESESEAKPSMEEVRQEISQRVVEAEEETGRKLKPEELRQLCSVVMQEARKRVESCQGGCMSKLTMGSPMKNVRGFESSALYGSA